MYTQADLDNLEITIADTRKKQTSLMQELKSLSEKRTVILLALNADNLKDAKWIIQHPNMPGVYEAINDLIVSNYGDLYSGPHPSGYIHDGQYNPIQYNFEFYLRDYKGDSKGRFKKNCQHFIDNYLQYLKPCTDIRDHLLFEFKVIPFQFHSRDSGLDQLGYDPSKDKWCWFEMRYGHPYFQRYFDSFDEAFETAYFLAQNED